MWFRLIITVLTVLSTSRCLSVKTEPWKFTSWKENSKTIEYISHRDAVVNSTIVDWGITIPESAEPVSCEDGDECLDYGVAKVTVTRQENCELIHWTTSELSELKDCINVDGHWYGGGAQYNEPWPLEKLPRIEGPYVTSDFLRGSELYGGILENYWISSQGIATHVDEEIPLFYSMPDNDGDGTSDQMCFASRYEDPYFPEDSSTSLNLTYHLCYANNVREVYESSFHKFYNYPTGIPDAGMISYPIWSTWAEFGPDIDQDKVLSMALDIHNNGFNKSQFEIDDNWETCYGDHQFDTSKFYNVSGMVEALKDLGFRITLWIHPFININCPSFEYADSNGFLVKDANGVTQITSWWQGDEAGYIDFTNPEAVSWWTQRLFDLQTETGISSYKFDAGETSWLPSVYTLNSHKSLWPNVFTSSYVKEVTKFGSMIETRVGHLNTESPIFIRMLDKSSTWTSENGLRTLVPSLLHEGLIGYPFVLPDMIGGNAYQGLPSEELYIRWAQANTFMPAIQFSILPWGYGNDSVTKVAKDISALHLEYSSTILGLAFDASLGQGPMMRPTWWLCPEHDDCLTADQQFLLGDDILVTPVVNEGATTLNIVVPPGSWQRQDDGTIYEGVSKQTIVDITLESNIYFKRI